MQYVDVAVDGIHCMHISRSDNPAFCSVVLTDLGAFILINVYVPNAGDRLGDGERTAFKVRFLEALKEKANALRAAGRQVLPCLSTMSEKIMTMATCNSHSVGGWNLIPRYASHHAMASASAARSSLWETSTWLLPRRMSTPN